MQAVPLEHIYSSFNDAIEALWGTVAAGVQFVIGHPDKPKTLPPDCLRVYWHDYGGPTEQPNEIRAAVQLDVFVPARNFALAAARAGALDTGMGFTDGSGYGVLGVVETGSDPAVFLGQANLYPMETGWLTVPDEVPGVVHLTRTIELFTTPITP